MRLCSHSIPNRSDLNIPTTKDVINVYELYDDVIHLRTILRTRIIVSAEVTLQWGNSTCTIVLSSITYVIRCAVPL